MSNVYNTPRARVITTDSLNSRPHTVHLWNPPDVGEMNFHRWQRGQKAMGLFIDVQKRQEYPHTRPPSCQGGAPDRQHGGRIRESLVAEE